MAVVVKDENIRIERLELKPYGTNAYIIICLKTKDSALVDAPGEPGKIMNGLKNTNPGYILMTHNHMDHMMALAELQSVLKVPVAAHALDSANLPVPAEILLNDGDVISVGELKVDVIHTPGHTPGSLCFRIENYLLSGDTIFTAGPGNTRSPDTFRQIVKSLTEKIFVLPDDTRIFPGHGDSTVLKKEKDEFAVFSSRPHKSNLCGDVIWLSS
jgi:glyoxylase-like metal-dependent hydrolase (beta-lactamase superfamily II)